ncbi:MAG: family 78 glycoside hydrolase catalytic domain [Bacteroidales bacterium]|nr:family 78 glycoside hydrolase catalytic domain [Bacteroidales bacterium]
MIKRLLAIVLLAVTLPAAAKVDVLSLKVNHMTSPGGVLGNPTFSWIAVSDRQCDSQSAYEIKVTDIGGRPVWSTGKVLSDNSVAVKYAGSELKPASTYFWQVRLWDAAGKAGRWSQKGSFVTGLPREDWKATWIAPEMSEASPLVRGSFTVNKPVKSAIAYFTAHGVYEAFLNGEKLGIAFMAPGYTSYNHHLMYQTYDVTELLKRGENVVGAELARGWHFSNMGWSDPTMYKPNFEGDKMALLGQIVITYKDGTQDVIVTDGSWKASTGGVLHSAIYDGETFDARKVPEGWCTSQFDASAWKTVETLNYGYDNLEPQTNEPVVTHELMPAKELIVTPAGELVIDFGQNLVGSEVISYAGKPGQEITVSHAEVLDENGNFYTHNLRSAQAQSKYICDGKRHDYTTRFTFYGFRYIKLEGIPKDEINLDDIVAEVRYSDLDATGTFECSNPLVNQLQSNIQWGLRGNFVDIPTDCPQRDERLGWTGDAEIFARTATFNRASYAFYSKWLKDLAFDQLPDGQVTDIVPMVHGLVGAGHVGWADAATIIPWTLYMAYGDPQVLEDQYASMKKWVDFIIGAAGESCLWNTGWHYGDWLAFDVDNDVAGRSSVTYVPLLQQCHFANSATIMADAAKVLGRADDELYYRNVAAKAREAFCKAYITADGYLVSHTQTAYVVALAYDMIPAEMRPLVASKLKERVESYGHITTGFLGTSHVTTALTACGLDDVAYKLLLHEGYPGWLYPVKMGATTIWERWNSMMPDGTIPDNGMNSFNHYSYGAIGDWLYREAAGLKEAEPGFSKICVKPHPGGGFTYMKAEQITPYGNAVSSWKLDGNLFTLEVEVPFNTTAEVYVPSSDGYTRHEVGSGHYVFSSEL